MCEIIDVFSNAVTPVVCSMTQQEYHGQSMMSGCVQDKEGLAILTFTCTSAQENLIFI
jgi:hypothetical protein